MQKVSLSWLTSLGDALLVLAQTPRSGELPRCVRYCGSTERTMARTFCLLYASTFVADRPLRIASAWAVPMRCPSSRTGRRRGSSCCCRGWS